MRTFLLSFAAAASLATSALAAVATPSENATNTSFEFTGFPTDFGFISHVSEEDGGEIYEMFYAVLDIPETGYTWWKEYNDGLFFWGDLVDAGIQDGKQRYTGSMEGQFMGFDGEEGNTVGEDLFAGVVTFAADGTWNCSGDCRLPTWNGLGFVASSTALTSGTYGAPLSGGETDPGIETPAPVPLPATAPLLGLALAGFAALRRRKAA